MEQKNIGFIENKNMEMDFPDLDSLNHNSMTEILKELFDKKKIYMIGDLTKDEIKLITRIYMIAELKDIPAWRTGVDMYIQLLLSKNRESRKEIISAIQGAVRKKNLGERIKNVFSGQEE